MSSGNSGLPPSTLYPVIFALISFCVIALFLGLTHAVRQQNRRNRRYLAFLQAHYDEVEAQRLRDEIDRPRPVMWEIEGETGALKRALWAQAAHAAGPKGASPTAEKSPHLPLTWSGMSPASAVPLAHPANKRVLPSTCPPLVLSTLILQPRPPRIHHHHHNTQASDAPGFADDDDDDDDSDSDDEDANNGSHHHHHHHHAGVEVDIGTERVDLEGDWRKVVGRTDLGFEF